MEVPKFSQPFASRTGVIFSFIRIHPKLKLFPILYITDVSAAAFPTLNLSIVSSQENNEYKCVSNEKRRYDHGRDEECSAECPRVDVKRDALVVGIEKSIEPHRLKSQTSGTANGQRFVRAAIKRRAKTAAPKSPQAAGTGEFRRKQWRHDSRKQKAQPNEPECMR